MKYNEVMKLSVNPRIFASFDNPRIAVTVVKNADNRSDISDFKPRLAKLADHLQKEYSGQTISQLTFP